MPAAEPGRSPIAMGRGQRHGPGAAGAQGLQLSHGGWEVPGRSDFDTEVVDGAAIGPGQDWPTNRSQSRRARRMNATSPA